MTTPDPLARFRLDGRVAVLTGASSGIGARWARVLDAAGAAVVLAARREERIAKLAVELRDAVAVRCDVASADDRDALLATALERHGRIDVLVNNAGTTNVIPAMEESDEDFARVLDVNLAAPFALARAAARSMVEAGTGGAIVNVASILGLLASGQVPQASYVASKAGLVNLTRELAVQWARSGIRVNAICPGWFPSEMTDDMFATERGQQFIRRRTPMGRAGTEDELDGALLFLASDASSFVTGHALVVDGGWSVV